MKFYVVTTLVLVGVLSACTNTLQTASINEAHKYFGSGNYEKTLKLITQASSTGGLSPEQQAELTYLKAQTFEQMNRPEDAAILYRYLLEQHPTSQYAYLAASHTNETR